MGNEKRENALLVLSTRRQNFRMPLHAENQSVVRAFDAFDHAVVGDGVDDQTVADAFDRLMMGGIHLQFSRRTMAISNSRVPRLRSTRWPPSAFLRALCSWAPAPAKLCRNVLIERAAQDDVDRLRAAADAEYRHVAF